MTAMDPAERDAYAEPGSLLREMLDAGVLDWPTREVAAQELALGDVIATGQGTFGQGGTYISIDYTNPKEQ